MDKTYLKGVKAILPIIPGVIPFGLIMGTVAINSGLTTIETMGLNFIVFAGASQLAAIELLNQDASGIAIVLTGFIINLRFLLYSAASSEYFKELSFFKKLYASYSLTDQSYAVTTAYESSLKTKQEKIFFALGAASMMALCWHLSVYLGIIAGTFIPKSLGVDFAVPLSFMALTIPSLTTKNHIFIAICSSLLSLILAKLPYNLALIVTAAICISIAYLLIKRSENDE